MRVLPYLAFFLSGASSLIFQALWTRMLHHTFGATSVAMSTVLTAFMSGLGLGAYLFGKRAAKLGRPLVVYALAELGVAACALAIPPLVDSDGPLSLLNASLRAQLGAHTHAFTFVRFACVWPILLLPTTLMGGTLPLLAQHFVRRRDDTSPRDATGVLYAVNTFGAVVGTLLASFVLMPAIGVRATNHVAVAINVALAAVILLLPMRERPPAKPLPRPPLASAIVARQRVALIAFGISGACAMTYEVVWSRALAMAIGSSLQSFALILTTFLFGLAGGSALASHVLGPAATRGLVPFALASFGLSAIALAPALLLAKTPLLPLFALALAAATLWLVSHVTLARARELADARADGLHELADEGARLLERGGTSCLIVPIAIAVFEVVRFATVRTRGDAVSVHGYLPYFAAATVTACAFLLALLSALRRSPYLLAAGVQLAIAIASFAGYAFQDEIPYGFARLVSTVRDLPLHVGTVRFFMLLTAGLCILPTALGLGAMFPVTLSLCSARKESLSADVGRVYAANTVGAILGSWLPGFVLLPWIGMERTLIGAMVLSALLALALLRAGRSVHAGTPARRSAHQLALAACALIVGLLAARSLPGSKLAWNLAHMTLGAFRVSLAKDVLDTTSWGEPELLYYRDGVSTTVSVERWGQHLTLKNNGKVDASNGDDMPTQIMVAAYPLLLHTRRDQPLDVAMIGFGSGVSAGAALRFPIARLDVIELEDAVVDAASRHFEQVSELPRTRETFPYVEAPRLTIHHDDGRNYLAASRQTYDVIISEPSNPWITGVSDLFTVDHFARSKRRLKPGGMYCQWVQLYELSPDNIKTVYRTFASQFRHVLAFSADARSSDTVLIGSDAPIPLDLAAVARALEATSVEDVLKRAEVHSAHDVFARLLFGSRQEVLQFSQLEQRRARGIMQPVIGATGADPCPAPDCRRTFAVENTDDNMLIELRAPADLIGFAAYEGYLELFYGADWPYGKLEGRLLHADRDRDRAAMARSLLAHGRIARARRFADLARDTADPEVRLALSALALLLGDAPEPTYARESPSLSVPRYYPDWQRLTTQRAEAEALFERGAYAESAALFEQLPLPLRTLAGPDLRARYALSLYRSAGSDAQRLRRAARELETLLRRDPTYEHAHPELRYFLARALFGGHRYENAVTQMQAYAASVRAPHLEAAALRR